MVDEMTSQTPLQIAPANLHVTLFLHYASPSCCVVGLFHELV